MNREQHHEIMGLINEALHKREIKFWQDPSHGWLQVPKNIIDDFLKYNRTSHLITLSQFVRKDENNYYLEEDSDMTIFFRSIIGINWHRLFAESVIPIQRTEDPFISKLPYRLN